MCDCFFFLQSCLEVEFFYFGLTFCHLKTRISDTVLSRIPFSIFRQDISEEIGKVIQQDIRKLNSNLVGGKKGFKLNGSFVKLDDKNIYVYEHSEHATCSSTTLSQLSGCVRVDRCEDDLVNCTCSAHASLLPFFVGNKAVLSQYKAHISNTGIQSEVTKLEKIIRGEESSEGTPYVTPISSFAFNWQENDWTKRLVPCIQKLFPDRTVTFTATMGLSWTTDLLKVCLKIGDIATKRQFLFCGSPDVVITKNRMVSLGDATQLELEESSGEEGLVENSRQPNPMQGISDSAFPEKLGEVFSGLYILLVSKILRKIGKRRDVLREFKVKGLLLSKVYGGIHCILSVHLKDGASDLNFKVIGYNVLLEPSSLCTLLHNIIRPF